MRHAFALLVALSVVGSSWLVYSQPRGTSEVMRYADVVAEYEPFARLGISAPKAWEAVVPLYPLVSGGGGGSVDPRKVNHLVEIYLRSHGLEACGHAAAHETMGTPCSFSKGTELRNLFVRVVRAMYERRALNGRAVLYLLEQEPEPWGPDEAWFLYDGRIVSSEVTITDEHVARKRQEFIAQGFQTAGEWSNEEIRRALLRADAGESLAGVDEAIGAARGDATRTMVNFLVRPLFLLLHCQDATYEGKLAGLPAFVAENLGRDLQVGAVQDVREALAQEKAPVVAEEIVAAAVEPLPDVKVEVLAAETPTAPMVAATAAEEEKTQDKKEEKQEEKTEQTPAAPAFARAYGGTRFNVGWGR